MMMSLKRKSIMTVAFTVASLSMVLLFQNCAGQNLTSADLNAQFANTEKAGHQANQGEPSAGIEESGTVSTQIVCTYYWYSGGFANGRLGPDNQPECGTNNVGEIAYNRDLGYRYTCTVSPSRCANAAPGTTQNVFVGSQ